jgi:hypothetical protein
MSETLLENELERLKQYKKDSQWFRDRYPQIKAKYKDKYVAILKGHVVDKDEDYRILITRLGKGNRDTTPYLIRLVREKPASFII